MNTPRSAAGFQDPSLSDERLSTPGPIVIEMMSKEERTSCIDKETNQKITSALQVVIKKLGKEIIRDRLKRKIDPNNPLDMESVQLAIEFFRREEKGKLFPLASDSEQCY